MNNRNQIAWAENLSSCEFLFLVLLQTKSRVLFLLHAIAAQHSFIPTQRVESPKKNTFIKKSAWRRERKREREGREKEVNKERKHVLISYAFLRTSKEFSLTVWKRKEKKFIILLLLHFSPLTHWSCNSQNLFFWWEANSKRNMNEKGEREREREKGTEKAGTTITMKGKNLLIALL